MDWKEFVYGYKNGHTWQETADEAKRRYPTEFGADAYNKVRQYLRRRYKHERTNDISHISLPQESPMYTISNEYKADGTFVSDKLITICEDTPITPESILKAHGLQAGLWQVVSYKNNLWHSQNKSNERMVMYQSKLVAKPIVNGLDFNQIEEFFKTKTFANEKPYTKPLQYDQSGEILEICFPDWHCGSLVWREETGEDYDINIAKNRLSVCIDDILYRCKNKKFKKIVFVTLGDVMHIDNDMQTTTKGTFQQSDGRVAKIAIASAEALIDAITKLGNIAPTEVIYLEGNHDMVSGFMLLLAVKNAFLNDKNIIFDIKPNSRKYRLFENVLIGWTHGNMNKKYQGKWILSEAKKEYGQSSFAEVHVGHFHTEKTYEIPLIESGDDGVIVRHLPNIASASTWEHKEGYPKHPKAVISYVWNLTYGLREVWHSCV